MNEVDIDVGIRKFKNRIQNIDPDDKEAIENIQKDIGQTLRRLETEYQNKLYDLEDLRNQIQEMLDNIRMKKKEERGDSYMRGGK